MKPQKLFFLSLFCLIALSSFADTTKVLFIGNSITYFNNMPQDFEQIALENEDTVDLTVYAPGGTGFVNHVADPNVYAYFMEGDWDYIVLQPGSNESPGYSYPIAETIERATQLINSAYKYNPCTSILFYEISYGVWGNTSGDLDTYNATMDLIMTNLTSLSDSVKCFFAPVGEAFRHAWNADQNNMLWGGTGDIHPNNKGSYLASCVFYASIFEKPSEGSTYIDGLDPIEASLFQHLADSITLQHGDLWRRHTYDADLDFDYVVTSGDVQFDYNSINIDSLQWDFGDGTNSTQLSESHVYTNNGSYNVNLTVYQHGCVYTISNVIEVEGLGIQDISKNKILIYPNPSKGEFQLKGEIPEGGTIKIFDAVGNLVSWTNTSYFKGDLSPGMYLVQLFDGKGIKWTERVIVEN